MAGGKAAAALLKMLSPRGAKGAVGAAERFAVPQKAGQILFSAAGKLPTGESKAQRLARRLIEGAVLAELRKEAAKAGVKSAVTKEQVRKAIASGSRGDVDEAIEAIANYWERPGGKMPTARQVDNMARKPKMADKIVSRASKYRAESRDLLRSTIKQQERDFQKRMATPGPSSAIDPEQVLNAPPDAAADLLAGLAAPAGTPTARGGRLNVAEKITHQAGILSRAARKGLPADRIRGVVRRRNMLTDPKGNKMPDGVADKIEEQAKEAAGVGSTRLRDFAMPAAFATAAFGVAPVAEQIAGAQGAPGQVRSQADAIMAGGFGDLPPEEELMALLQKNRARMAMMDPETVSRLVGNLAATTGEFVVGAPAGPDILNEVILRSMLSGAAAGGEGLGRLDPNVLKTLMGNQ